MDNTFYEFEVAARVSPWNCGNVQRPQTWGQKMKHKFAWQQSLFFLLSLAWQKQDANMPRRFSVRYFV